MIADIKCASEQKELLAELSISFAISLKIYQEMAKKKKNKPNLLRTLGLDASQIEDMEKPRQELEELLSVVN